MAKMKFVVGLAVVSALATMAAAVYARIPDPPDNSYDAAVLEYAEEYGITSAEARAELALHIRIVEFAEEARRSMSGYAGFKIERTDSGPMGVLALSGAGSRAAIPTDLPINVVSAQFTQAEADGLRTRYETELQVLDESIVGLSYDPFSDRFTVWKMPKGPERPDLSINDRARTFLANELQRQFDVSVVTEAEAAHGGLRNIADRRWQFDIQCTTGFGVQTVSDGEELSGYITAGHCRNGDRSSWLVETQFGSAPVSTHWDIRIGGYQDSVVMEAAGAEPLLVSGVTDGVERIEPVSDNPVRATPGMFLCHYGRTSNDLECGPLHDVNHSGWYDDDGTIFRFWWDATDPNGTVECERGDSGGPVWLPGNHDVGGVNRPAGLISAFSDGNNRCFYVPITDNLGNWDLIPLYLIPG